MDEHDFFIDTNNMAHTPSAEPFLLVVSISIILIVLIIAVTGLCCYYYNINRLDPDPDPDPDPPGPGPDPPLDVYEFNPRYNTEPDFSDYDIDSAGRIKYEWDTSARGLVNICEFWNQSIGWYQNNQAITAGDYEILDDWILNIADALDASGYTGTPWGDNVHVFSCVLPITLSYYLLLQNHTESVADVCCRTLHALIPNPRESLGVTYSEIDCIGMIFPWMIAGQYDGTFNDQDPAYLDMLSLLDQGIVDPTLNKYDVGLRVDYGFLSNDKTHDHRFFEILDIYYYDLSKCITKLENMNIAETLDKLTYIYNHPTIPFSNIQSWGPSSDLACDLYKGSLPHRDIEMIQSCNFIRYYTADWQWAYRFAEIDQAYYIPYRLDEDNALFNMQCVGPHYKDTTVVEATNIPALGMIYPAGLTKLITVTEPAIGTGMLTGDCKSSYTYMFTDYVTYAVACGQNVRYGGDDIWSELPISFSTTIVIDIVNSIIYVYYKLEDAAEKSTKNKHFRKKKKVEKRNANYKICIDSDGSDVGITENTIVGITINLTTKTTSYDKDVTEVPSIHTLTNNKFSVLNFVPSIERVDSMKVIIKDDLPYCLIPGRNESGDMVTLATDVPVKCSITPNEEYIYDPSMGQWMNTLLN
ncbi:ODV-E66 [Crangon crangon nudivirus]|uniref:ODV-E66 n=1 Tax=Crangon crangon nudivirus TaxID=2880838 RepID=A0AAE9BZ65_9VIRU|nr:ODV-E66 [Crangon crangon nudivirus]UBZ25513.1 ODV-E66 [Crangon crangon nudivirus]